jgi:hypothetical protein
MTNLYPSTRNRDKILLATKSDKVLYAPQNTFACNPTMHKKANPLDRLLHKYSINQQAIILNQLFNPKF